AALAAAAGATAARSASGAGVTAAESGASPAEAARDSAALAELPPDAALAYAAAGSLWAIDRAGGVRRMAQNPGLTAPVVSGDRAWIAYRQPGKDGVEIWGVPWAGGDARLLLAERELNKEASAGYQPWRFQDVRWLPGKRALAVTVSAAALTPGVAPRLELWMVEVEAGLRRLVTSSDINFRPIVAPNGAAVAFLRREPGKRGEGSVWLIGTDGAGERAVLRFPLPDDQPGDDAQIGWLPDSSGFWLALPQAGTKARALYRISAAGDAQPAGTLEAQQIFWSPDGARLAYTRPVSDTAGPQELYVASADGTQSRLYATLTRGRFVAWAADSVHFLYEDSGQVFAGAVDQGALRLASNAGEPRWLGANQALYVTQPGASRQLVYQVVSGQPVVLQTLPPNTSLDGLWP
ncbi:MAG: eukaryotic-like serine/threonine-protein kinase, partial [Chloroflexota bacterium]|nr:eukaryotic-like serine/threonine-protein kinase [Chloroflexota bacterium]